MTDLILSVPRYVSDAGKMMDLELFKRNLKVIDSVKRNTLYLHGDWSVGADILKPYLDAVERTNLNVTYCVEASEPFEGLAALLSPKAKIEISIGETALGNSFESLSKYENVSFFLPLKNPDTAVEKSLEQVLELYAKPGRIGLGVGWSDRLSGPEPIADEKQDGFAEYLVSLVRSISKKSIKMTFYCGLKLCMFNKLQLGDLAARNITWPIATCPRPFLFTTNGDIRPCVRLPLPDSIDMTGITDLDETADAVNQWLTPFLGLCYDSETFNCRSLKVNSCSTGCLEHSLAGWQS